MIIYKSRLCVAWIFFAIRDKPKNGKGVFILDQNIEKRALEAYEKAESYFKKAFAEKKEAKAKKLWQDALNVAENSAKLAEDWFASDIDIEEKQNRASPLKIRTERLKITAQKAHESFEKESSEIFSIVNLLVAEMRKQNSQDSLNEALQALQRHLEEKDKEREVDISREKLKQLCNTVHKDAKQWRDDASVDKTLAEEAGVFFAAIDSYEKAKKAANNKQIRAWETAKGDAEKYVLFNGGTPQHMRAKKFADEINNGAAEATNFAVVQRARMDAETAYANAKNGNDTWENARTLADKYQNNALGRFNTLYWADHEFSTEVVFEKNRAEAYFEMIKFLSEWKSLEKEKWEPEILQNLENLQAAKTALNNAKELGNEAKEKLEAAKEAAEAYAKKIYVFREEDFEDNDIWSEDRVKAIMKEIDDRIIRIDDYIKLLELRPRAQEARIKAKFDDASWKNDASSAKEEERKASITDVLDHIRKLYEAAMRVMEGNDNVAKQNAEEAISEAINMWLEVISYE